MVNSAKTFILLAGLISILMMGGQLVGGTSGLMLGGSLGVIMAFVSFWFSDKMVMRGYGARLVTAAEAPDLVGLVDELRQRAGLLMPRVAVIPSLQPNAFATGRSEAKAIVAVTEGMLRTLPRDELAGVIAHELAHIKNKDMLIQTVAAGIGSMISVLPWLVGSMMRRNDDDRGGIGDIAFMILAPFVAMMLQFAISRQREFAADRTGAEIVGKARPLAQALTRMDAMAKQIELPVSPSLAALAIVNPLKAGGLMKLFSTHPPTEERVAALLAFDAERAAA